MLRDSEIAHLAYSVFLNDAPRALMAMFTAYFDAAGHPDGKQALVVNGYVASVPRWLRFEQRWKATLAEAGINTPFHMADFMANQDDFKGWKQREDEKSMLLLSLARVIRRHTKHSFAEAVLLDDWNEVNKTYDLDGNHCHPYALASFYVMDRSVRWMKAAQPDTDLNRFVFEDGDKDKGHFMWFMDTIVRDARKGLRVHIPEVTPIFEPKKLAPLQAADLVAWTYRETIRRVLRKNMSLEITDATQVPDFTDWMRELAKVKHTWGYLNAQSIVKFCDDFHVPKRGETHRWTGPGVRRDGP